MGGGFWSSPIPSLLSTAVSPPLLRARSAIAALSRGEKQVTLTQANRYFRPRQVWNKGAAHRNLQEEEHIDLLDRNIAVLKGGGT